MGGALPAIPIVGAMTRTKPRAAFLSTLLIATIAGCSSPTSPTASGTQLSPGAVGSGAGSGAPGTGTGPGARAFTDAASLASVADIAAAENRLVDAFAIAAGLPADLHPDTWAWVNRTVHDELAKAGESVTVTGADALVASLTAGPPRTAVNGGAGVGLAMAAALINSGLGSGNLANANVSLNSTQTTTANGEQTTGIVTGHIATSGSGSIVEADVQIGVQVTVTDAATGAVLRTATFNSQGKIKLDTCPDADGKVRGHVSMTLDGGTSGAGSASMTVDADVEGSVGEDAYLQQIDASGTSTQSTTARGASAARRSVVSAGFTSAVNRAGTMTGTANSHGQVVSGPADLTDAEIDSAYGDIGAATGSAIWLLGDYAQSKWRGGACVEIHATERSRDVRKNETVQFEARPFHKIEGTELHKPIVATFVGKASAEPLDVPVPSPILVSYKAGPNSNDSGTVTLTSTSNRGIGKLDLTFRVKGGWIIDATYAGGSAHGQKCGDPPGPWILDGTYEPANLAIPGISVAGTFKGTQKWTITINADEKTGTFVYSTNAKGKFVGAPVVVTLVGSAKGTVSLSIDPVSGLAHMDLQETKHTYRATVPYGQGNDSNAPLDDYTLDWDVGGTC